MLFDQRPKDNPRDLFDAEVQLEELLQAIKRGLPLVTIVGLRRTGKAPLYKKTMVAFLPFEEGVERPKDGKEVNQGHYDKDTI